MKDETPLELMKYKFSNLYRAVPLLRKMDRYLWERAESYQIKNVNLNKFNTMLGKVNNLMGIRTGNLNPMKSLKELIDDTKNIMLDEKGQVEQLINESDFEKIHKIIKQITNLVDNDGYGLKDDKETDKKYLKYKRQIEKYYDDNCELINPLLNYMITVHTHFSEYFADMLLVIKRTDLISEKTHIPLFIELADSDTQANLANLKNSTNEQLAGLRAEMTAYINEMEKEQWKLIVAVNTANPST